jgi:hypothetical protein
MFVFFCDVLYMLVFYRYWQVSLVHMILLRDIQPSVQYGAVCSVVKVWWCVWEVSALRRQPHKHAKLSNIINTSFVYEYHHTTGNTEAPGY